jgi:hypothetical protein
LVTRARQRWHSKLTSPPMLQALRRNRRGSSACQSALWVGQVPVGEQVVPVLHGLGEGLLGLLVRLPGGALEHGQNLGLDLGPQGGGNENAKGLALVVVQNGIWAFGHGFLLVGVARRTGRLRTT